MQNTNPKFIPILFSTDMVRAILDGRKTQTRRIFKMQKHIREPQIGYTAFTGEREISVRGYHANGQWGESFFKCPYGMKGDILWVREKTCKITSDKSPYDFKYFYATTQDAEKSFYFNKWAPSIHMPKAACRIFLRITSITVEKLQDISAKDAIAEGIELHPDTITLYKAYQPFYQNEYASRYYPDINDRQWVDTPILSYFGLWAKINGTPDVKGCHAFIDNPYVWVIKFERIEKPENFI